MSEASPGMTFGGGRQGGADEGSVTSVIDVTTLVSGFVARLLVILAVTVMLVRREVQEGSRISITTALRAPRALPRLWCGRVAGHGAARIVNGGT